MRYKNCIGDRITKSNFNHNMKLLEKINKVRVKDKLQPLSYKIRKCLKCTNEFISVEGKRICENCSKDNTKFMKKLGKDFNSTIIDTIL